jgi:hypothetical protein
VVSLTFFIEANMAKNTQRGFSNQAEKREKIEKENRNLG